MAGKTPSSERLLERDARGSDSSVEELSLASDDHTALTSELEVGSCSTGVDLANELSRWVVDPNTIAAAGVDTTLGVSVHTIGDERRDVCKGLAVLESTVLGDVERVDGRWRGQVAAVEPESNASVGHVCLIAIGCDGDAVGEGEVVGNDREGTALEVVTVHLVP